MFSSRLSFADTTNALSKAKAKRLAAGQPVLDLADSNPANAGFAWSAADLGPLLRRDGVQRQDPNPLGMASARTAISDYYSARGARVPVDQLFLTASTSEAYSWVFKLLCNPGDEVLVHGAPVMASYGQVVVEDRTATITRASLLERLWTRATGDFEFMELCEFSFSEEVTL